MPMPEEMFIVAASYTNSLTLLAFSPPAVFEAVCEIEIGFHPSWVTQHPLNPSLIFAGLEQEDGEVVAVLFDTQSGKGKVVGRAKSGGGSPCTLLSTEDELIVGNVRSAYTPCLPECLAENAHANSLYSTCQLQFHPSLSPPNPPICSQTRRTRPSH